MFLCLVVSPEEGGVSSRAHRGVVYHIYHIRIYVYRLHRGCMYFTSPPRLYRRPPGCCEDLRIRRIEHPVKSPSSALQ